MDVWAGECWQKNGSPLRAFWVWAGALERGKSDSVDWQPVNPILLRRRAQTWLSLHLSLEVPASELEVTGNFQANCSNIFVGVCVGWWDELASLPTPPPPSISWPGNHACSTSPPPLLLRSPASPLLHRQQRGTIHHFNSSSHQGQAHGQSLLPVGSAMLVFNLKWLLLLRKAVGTGRWKITVEHIQLKIFCPQGYCQVKIVCGSRWKSR